jgi:hypothetical protein
MGPFGDEEDAEIVGEVVDGHVASSSSSSPELHEAKAPPGVVVMQPPDGWQSLDQSGAYMPADVTDQLLQLAQDQRSRAIALFLEVPFCAYLALHPKLPGLVRLGAAALGIVRTVEVVQRQRELEAYLPELT